MANWQAIFSKGNTAQNAAPDANKATNQGAFTNAVQNTGAYDIPVLGGILRGVSQPILNAAETGAEGVKAGAQVVGDMAHGQSLQQALHNPYTPSIVSPDEAKVLTSGTPDQVRNEGIKEGLGVDTSLGDMMGIASIPNAIKSIPTIAKVATGKGLWEDIVNAAQNPVTYSNVEKRALQSTGNAVAPVKQALSQILQDETPAAGSDINAPLQYTGQQAVEKSASVGKMIPKSSFLNRSNADSAQTMAYKSFRDALSKEAQSANSATLPQAYKNYATHQAIKSAVPKVLAGAGVGGGTLAGINFLLNLFKGGSANTDTSGQ